MADTIPGDTTTTATITVGGGTVTNTLETGADHDWFRIDLTAGQTITINLNGTGDVPPDTYLQFRDSAGAVLAFDDDGGPGYNSALQFTATATGSYYIDVGSFADSESGTYQLSVVGSAPLPAYNNGQIADQLINGYWASEAEAARHFNVAPGGTLDVNVTGLTTEGQFLARQALALWSDVTGIVFNEVTTAADITFDDADTGAYNISSTSGGFITASNVNVGLDWIDPALGGYGFELNSYSFQTYIHEIGHALGLGHAGNYNGDADYLTDAHYANDSWPTTVMSYFDQNANFYFQSRGFTNFYVVTPMAADILAMSQMYGSSTTTRAGNTTYGFASTAGRDVFNAALNPDVAYTIFDSGGIDTLNYSGFAANQLIDLRPETFSNVGNAIGNVTIARGVVIENAVGGNGNDTIVGNSANNRLTGGLGNDILSGGTGIDAAAYTTAGAGVTVDLNLTGYQNTIGAGSDRLIAIENLLGSRFADSLTGNAAANQLYGYGGNDMLAGGGGNDTLDGGLGDDTLVGGSGVDTALYSAASGGVVVNLATGAAQNTVNAGIDTLTSIENVTGSTFADRLLGSGAANRLLGGAGNDTLRGGGGNDTLIGGTGNDVIEGGPGDDVMDGGDGVDIANYVPATAGVTVNLGLTTVQNTVGAGNDRLLNFERLYGSNFHDTLTGGAAGELITGRLGNDVINGGGGADKIYGNEGNDTLSGGAGNDWLYGGAGQDLFRFDSALAANVDMMADFSSADDTVQLSQAVFSAIGAGTLAASAFQIGTAANDAQDRIIHDPATGRIYYDSDGNGAASKILFARVLPGVTMTSSDFQIVGSSVQAQADDHGAAKEMPLVDYAKADYLMF